MAQAEARHILVNSHELCEELIKKINSGSNFSKLAKEHSLCPSKSKGGDLGLFSQGAMVQEFDEAVFSADVGALNGPVKTKFGYHLFEVTYRR